MRSKEKKIKEVLISFLVVAFDTRQIMKLKRSDERFLDTSTIQQQNQFAGSCNICFFLFFFFL